jgi:hypothetical protein
MGNNSTIEPLIPRPECEIVEKRLMEIRCRDRTIGTMREREDREGDVDA